MTTKTPNILSIGIKRQRVGIAVFTNGRLEYVTGRALPTGSSREGRRELSADIKKLIRRHDIGIVTMSQLTVQQRSSRSVVRLYKRVQSTVILGGHALVVGNDNLATRKRGMEENLTEIYPELRRYLGDAAWERRYYKHIFKAVSAGVAWLRINENERIPNDR